MSRPPPQGPFPIQLHDSSPRESTDHPRLWSQPGCPGSAGAARASRENLVIYELHVGTYSPEGTFEGVTLARQST